MLQKEERERAKDWRYSPPCHLFFHSEKRNYISSRINTEQRQAWAAGNRHIHSHLGGEEATDSEKSKEQKTQGITDGVWR